MHRAPFGQPQTSRSGTDDEVKIPLTWEGHIRMAVLDNATQRLASASACAVGMDHVVSLKTCDPWYAFLVFTIHTRHSTGWISWRSQMFMFRSCHEHKSTHPLFTQSHVRHVARSFTNGKHIGEVSVDRGSRPLCGIGNTEDELLLP